MERIKKIVRLVEELDFDSNMKRECNINRVSNH